MYLISHPVERSTGLGEITNYLVLSWGQVIRQSNVLQISAFQRCSSREYTYAGTFDKKCLCANFRCGKLNCWVKNLLDMTTDYYCANNDDCIAFILISWQDYGSNNLFPEENLIFTSINNTCLISPILILT